MRSFSCRNLKIFDELGINIKEYRETNYLNPKLTDFVIRCGKYFYVVPEKVKIVYDSRQLCYYIIRTDVTDYGNWHFDTLLYSETHGTSITLKYANLDKLHYKYYPIVACSRKIYNRKLPFNAQRTYYIQLFTFKKKKHKCKNSI